MGAMANILAARFLYISNNARPNGRKRIHDVNTAVLRYMLMIGVIIDRIVNQQKRKKLSTIQRICHWNVQKLQWTKHCQRCLVNPTWLNAKNAAPRMQCGNVKNVSSHCVQCAKWICIERVLG